MTAWLGIAALLAIQGEAVLVELPAEGQLADAATVELTWQDQSVELTRRGDAWVALLGVDLDVAPGEYELPVRYSDAAGNEAVLPETLRVGQGDYPQTHLEVAERFVNLADEDQQRAARESRRIAAVYSTRSDERDWLTPFAAPLPGVSGGRNFGHRRFFNGQPRNPHSGVDLRAGEGTEVFAANGGRVALADDLFFSGNAVFIDHGAGVVSVYLHLSRIDVVEGERVERGQAIGLSGSTGRVTGPHLHWGIRVLEARVDPFTLPGLNAGER